MTDVIVNRVPKTFGQKLEESKLESSNSSAATTTGNFWLNRITSDPETQRPAEVIADANAMGEGFPTQAQRDLVRVSTVAQVQDVKLDRMDNEGSRTEYHVPPHVGETVVLQSHQTAEHSRTGQIGQIEDLPEQDPEDAAAAEKANGLSLSDQLTALGYFDHTEFVKFKSQVIACLRHAGFDVKKFFGV
jgi:hypothetical protein